MWADEDKLDKICFNLLSNAMKFTQAGGKVEFGIDIISREEALRFVALEEKDVDNRYMKIVVKDSGPGIPERQLEKIFDRPSSDYTVIRKHYQRNYHSEQSYPFPCRASRKILICGKSILLASASYHEFRYEYRHA